MWYGKPPIHCDLLNAVAFGVIGDLLADSLLFRLGSFDGNVALREVGKDCIDSCLPF